MDWKGVGKQKGPLRVHTGLYRKKSRALPIPPVRRAQ